MLRPLTCFHGAYGTRQSRRKFLAGPSGRIYIRAATAPAGEGCMLRPINNASLKILFSVSAKFDDRVVSATAETAQLAFAKAIEWQLKFANVSISDGVSSFTVEEFSALIAKDGSERL